jgi:hypothetical protein
MTPPVRKSMSAVRLDGRHSIIREQLRRWITPGQNRGPPGSGGRRSPAANLLGAAAAGRSTNAAARVATGVPGPAHGVAACRPADPEAVRASCRRVAVVQWVIHADGPFGAEKTCDPATGHGHRWGAPDAVADALPSRPTGAEALPAAFGAAPRAGRIGVGTADQGKHSGPQAAQHRPEHRPAGMSHREGPGDVVEPLSVHAAPPCAPLSDAPLASGLQVAPAL